MQAWRRLTANPDFRTVAGVVNEQAVKNGGGRAADPRREDEQIICGLRCCEAVFRRRPMDIARIFLRLDREARVGHMLRWAAAKRRTWRELDDEHLRRVTGSVHHDGIAMAVRSLRCSAFDIEAARRKTWIALDQIENPHNVGAIVRTGAFFGLGGVLLGGVEPGTRVNGALIRLAEGGAEMMDLCGCGALPPRLAALNEAGVPVYGFEPDGEPFPGETALPRRCVLVFANEQAGIAPESRRFCTKILSVEGTGHIGSLNVSVTVGIVLAEWRRRNPPK